MSGAISGASSSNQILTVPGIYNEGNTCFMNR